MSIRNVDRILQVLSWAYDSAAIHVSVRKNDTCLVLVRLIRVCVLGTECMCGSCFTGGCRGEEIFCCRVCLPLAVKAVLLLCSCCSLHRKLGQLPPQSDNIWAFIIFHEWLKSFSGIKVLITSKVHWLSLSFHYPGRESAAVYLYNYIL